MELAEDICILVPSCDKNEDLFYPFYHCMEKYWPDHPKVYYSTETIKNPYYETFSFDYPLSSWAKRVLESVNKIDSPYVLLMVDDIFIRQKVNNRLIHSLPFYFSENVAAINFEFLFDLRDEFVQDFIFKRNPIGRYKNSMMCQLWCKKKLKTILSYKNGELDPWGVEAANYNAGFDYLITPTGILNFGKYKTNDWRNWGVFHGLWAPSTVDFLKSEGLAIDFSKRGILQL